MDRHIEILLLDNDCVIVPGLGGFMAHYEQARLDDRDNMFLPPFRSIGFNQKLTLNDSLLVQSYVEAYDLSYPDALKRIEDEVRELRQRLDTEGSVTFNDLGVLSLNADGHLEFEPCEAGILTPELYGLSGFDLKPLSALAPSSQTAADVAARPSQVMGTMSTATTASDNTFPNPSDESEEENEPSYIRLRVSWIRNAIVAAAALLAFIFLPSPLNAPTEYPLESGIDTGLLLRVMPKNVTTGEKEIKKAAIQRHESIVHAQHPNRQGSTEWYTLVLAARITKNNAKTYAAQLQAKGVHAEVYSDVHGVKVVYGSYATKSDALSKLNELNDNQVFKDAWIMKCNSEKE